MGSIYDALYTKELASIRKPKKQKDRERLAAISSRLRSRTSAAPSAALDDVNFDRPAHLQAQAWRRCGSCDRALRLRHLQPSDFNVNRPAPLMRVLLSCLLRGNDHSFTQLRRYCLSVHARAHIFVDDLCASRLPIRSCSFSKSRVQPSAGAVQHGGLEGRSFAFSFRWDAVEYEAGSLPSYGTARES